MTAESLKSFISLPSHGSQCSNNRYANGNKIRNTIFAVFMVLLSCGILGLEIWNTIRTTQLAQETDQLRNALDELKHRIGFDNMDDLEDFVNSYDHTDGMPEDSIEPIEDGLLGTFDDADDDEFTYDDDDELEGSSDFDKDDYEIGETMYDDSVTTSSRHVRSATSIHGVPIVEESYALHRNRTNPRVDDEISRLLLNKGRPTLRHADWNAGRQPPANNLQQYRHGSYRTPPTRNLPVNHHDSIPYKYQQHRAPPTEYVQSPYRVGSTSNKNNFHQYANQQRNQQDVTASSPNVNVRSGRTMPTKDDKTKAFRQTVKKSEIAKLRKQRMLEIRDDVEMITPGPVRRTNPNHRSGRGQATHQNHANAVAIHYSGNPSQHKSQDEHGRLTQNGGTYTAWLASSWASNSDFQLEGGVVTVKKSGLYYVYAQIYYHGPRDKNIFFVKHNGHTFIQCAVESRDHQGHNIDKHNSCFTSGITKLRENDKIQVENSGLGHVLFDPEHSFFGLMKIGDVEP